MRKSPVSPSFSGTGHCSLGPHTRGSHGSHRGALLRSLFRPLENRLHSALQSSNKAAHCACQTLRLQKQREGLARAICEPLLVEFVTRSKVEFMNRLRLGVGEYIPQHQLPRSELTGIEVKRVLIQHELAI